MKSSIRSRSRRKGGRSSEKKALLSKPSPPPSPSVWGVQDDVGLYPTRAPSLDPPTRSKRMEAPAPHASSTSSSALPPENRFHPQHEPRKGHAPEHVISTSALQFVPAYEESTSKPIVTKTSRLTPSPTKKQRSPQSSLSPNTKQEREDPPPAWDAVIEADDASLRSKESLRSSREGRSRRCRDKSIDSFSSAEEKKSSPTAARRGRRRNNNGAAGPPKVIGANRRSPSAEEVAGSTVGGGSKRGPRMARLASIFASRGAQVSKSNSPTKEPKSGLTRSAAAAQAKKTNAAPPASPSHSHVSSSSSGYVGWPGTQDKRGKTVAMESSYDDSSVGPAAFHRKKYEDELDRLEVRKWAPDDQSNASSGNLLAPRGGSDSGGSEAESAADFHLRAVLEGARITPSPPKPRSQQLVLRNGDKVKKNSSISPPGALNHRFKPRQASQSFNSGTRSQAGSVSVAATSASGALSIHNLFANNNDPPAVLPPSAEAFQEDPWDVDTSSQPPSSPGTSVSKDSSAFFHTTSMPSAEFPNLDPQYGVRPNLKGAASIIRRRHESPPLSEEALKVQDHLTPPVRSFNSQNVRGFRGYLDKTKDVPNLMDDEIDSDSLASSRAASTSDHLPPSGQTRSRLQAHMTKTRNHLRQRRDPDDDSDVFDGISQSERGSISRLPNGSNIKPPDDSSSMNVVMLGGGLATIQTTQEDFERREMASDYDDNLTNSEVDQYGFAKTPGFHKMIDAGRNRVDSAKYIDSVGREESSDDEGPPIRQVIPATSSRSPSSKFRKQDPPPQSASRQLVLHQGGTVFDANFSDFGNGSSDYQDAANTALVPFRGDLSKYRVHPSTSKRLVSLWRSMSRSASTDMDLMEFKEREDAKKVFALSEMRSRIMEKDLERGLERQGGSKTVDDIILTPYYQAAYRVRDAVIVSKAWRDGASPSDVTTANLMTRRAERTYYIKRPVRVRSPRAPRHDNMSVTSDYSYGGGGITRAYVFEERDWMDDADFTQMRCPSLGPRFMRGFEMFTIGDCQSILLKLTNERCIQLRKELHEATATQIDAEDMMREEGDPGDGMMTESEMIYLTAMEDVKTISKQLVVAEKSFNLVRDRIEKLVARYEAMLIKIENESIATASVITFDESSYYSDDDYDSDYSTEAEEEDDRVMFQRRAQRAELRAELAAREALMAKQAAQRIQEDKQREIEALQQKLADLQSESSYAITEREQSIVLAKAIAQKHGVGDRGSHHGSKAASGMNDERISGVKQKFRDRMAERLQARNAPGNYPRSVNGSEASSSIQPYGARRLQPTYQRHAVPSARSQRRMLVGEEMYQHLDFYERSLKAVDSRM